MSKKCNKCGEAKPYTEFYKDKRNSKTGVGGICKDCTRITNNKKNALNKDKVNEKSRESYARTKKASLARKAKYYTDNKDSYAIWRKLNAQANRPREHDRAREYRKRNLDKDCEKVARRNASKKQRTPSWSDTEWDAFVKQEMYAHSKHLKILTGIQHNVDHVIPLQGVNVSGLHVWSNLRVITEHENNVKSNKHNVFA